MWRQEEGFDNREALEEARRQQRKIGQHHPVEVNSPYIVNDPKGVALKLKDRAEVEDPLDESPAKSGFDSEYIEPIDPKEFNGTPVPILTQIAWVASNIDNPAAVHREAPNTATWSMLTQARTSERTRREFWQLYSKLIPTKKEIEEEEAKKATVPATLAPIENFLRAYGALKE